MNIYIYSDESGVFDRVHNRYFIFGGIVFLSKDEHDACARMYLKAERDVRRSAHISEDREVKASVLPNKHKAKLFRSMNHRHRFGVIVDLNLVLDRIFASKKDKQRYQDYAYKIAVKRLFEKLISENVIIPSEVENIYFYTDEHTTATNGLYELRTSLEQEFKSGTYNRNFSKFFPPIFPSLKSLSLRYCNSNTKVLVRAADIVANNIYHKAIEDDSFSSSRDDLFVIRLP